MKNLFQFLLVPLLAMTLVACPPPVDSNLDSDTDGITTADELIGWEVVISRGETKISTRKVTSDPSKSDSDNDGLTDSQERTRFLDPKSDDTDADGLKDAAEVNIWVSEPANVDTDKDSEGNSGLFDGNELSTYGTSPTLADTDGDGRSDHQEAVVLGGDFKPLIANTPRFELSFADAPTISLKIVKTADQSVVATKTSSLSFGTTTSQSSTDTNTERFSAEVSATASAEATAGVNAGVTVSGSVTATAGYGTENTKSFTSESSQNSQRTAEEARTLGSTVGQQISGAKITVGFKVTNTGKVGFKLSGLKISVLRRDTNNPTKFILIGNMDTLADLTLGVNEVTGSLGATYDFTNSDEAIAVMSNPANLRFELAGYDILDADNRSFKFQNDTTNGQTAYVVIDYGNGNTIRHRVATNVERVNGQIVGVKIGKVLKDILGLSYTTETIKKQNTILKVISGIQDDKGQMISSKTNADPTSFWAVVGSKELNMTGVNPDDILIKSGSEVRLMLARDADKDGLLESEEYFLGSSDTKKDTDADGVDDFTEVRTGWLVTVGAVSKRVFSNPNVVDTDSDTLTDDVEKTKGSDPRKADSDDDGTTDNIDPEILIPAPPMKIEVQGYKVLSGRRLNVTALITNTNLSNTTIYWGDGNVTELTGNEARSVNTTHTYSINGSSSFTVTIVTTDTSTPNPKSVSVSQLLSLLIVL
jgi:hypothetical protein